MGLKGKQIALEARITALADVFDALFNARPHKPAWSVEQVTDYLKAESGKHFDPELSAWYRQHRQFVAIQESHPSTAQPWGNFHNVYDDEAPTHNGRSA